MVVAGFDAGHVGAIAAGFVGAVDDAVVKGKGLQSAVGSAEAACGAVGFEVTELGFWRL
jgi:hypothetical protein